MPSEIDIFRSAQVLVRQHGAEAKIIAAQYADACMDNGDLDGRATWLRVIRAIETLQDASPPGQGSALH